jgi:hypothetical protein
MGECELSWIKTSACMSKQILGNVICDVRWLKLITVQVPARKLIPTSYLRFQRGDTVVKTL